MRFRVRDGLAGLLLIVLAACAGGEEEFAAGPVEGFAGIVAADEPRAALVGRDILANGGSAGDAAVAMYFAMAVTLPSRVGLAGGGVCLAFDRRTKDAYVIDFMARPGVEGGVVPLGVRAMALLHARSGLNQWGALVGPAESLARFGHRASRALVRDLAAARATVAAEPVLAALFTDASGRLLDEGDRVEQITLSTVLSGIRGQGAGFFHGGSFAERYAAASRAAGQPVTSQEFRRAVPAVAKPDAHDVGSETLYFPKLGEGEAAVATLWRLLRERGYASSGSRQRERLFLEAGVRALGPGATYATPGPRLVRDKPLEGDDGVTLAAADPDDETQPRPVPLPLAATGPSAGAGFVAGDRWGSAVACAMTMNGLFGAGRVAGDTGLLLAAPPRPGEQPLGVAILANKVSGEAHLAASAAGGDASQTALARVLLDVLLKERNLEAAIAAPRLHPAAAGREVYYEPGIARDTIDGLRGEGRGLVPAVGLGLVEAFSCAEGLADSDQGCQWATDPRGAGLATVVQ